LQKPFQSFDRSKQSLQHEIYDTQTWQSLLRYSFSSMTKSKLFNQFYKQRKAVESLPKPSPPLPAETNPLVKQQQEQEDEITLDSTCSDSAKTRKLVLKAPQIQDTPHRVQDPQHTLSTSTVGEINEIVTEQLNGRQQTPNQEFQSNKKRRHHQYRLCYNSRQTGHFTINCPQPTGKGVN